MKREYSKEGDVLVFKFYVPGWSQVAIDEFVNEVVAQGERSDYHPEATIIEQEVEQLDVDAERRAFAEECADEEDETESFERDDPDDDRSPDSNYPDDRDLP